MPQYLVTIYRPDSYVPSLEDQEMVQSIAALNQEMIAAGVRKLACGLAPVAHAASLRPQGDGEVLISEGPYLTTEEHVGGFWILETADREGAVYWARKAFTACKAPVEVRAMHFRPTPAGTEA